jgi:hypothetical protein
MDLLESGPNHQKVFPECYPKINKNKMKEYLPLSEKKERSGV